MKLKVPNFYYYFKKLPKFVQKALSIVLIITTLTIGTGLIYLFGPWTKRAEAVWYDDNFAYRQYVALTNAGSALTDYPVSITLDTATLITASKMQSDCDDIRVTDVNGRVLSYLLDTGATACNTSITNIWVKVPSIPTSGATLYIYYGNPTAVNKQNGNNVFTEWDLTTFTETDPNSRLAIDSSKQITITNLTSNEEAYIYKTVTSRSTGTIEFDAIRTSGDNKITCVGVSSQIDDCNGSTDGAWMIWRWGGFFRGLRGDNTQTADIGAMTQDGATTYYMRVKYDGTNATFYVYSNAARTTLVGSQSFTFSSSFTYLYAASSYNDSSAATINDTIRNFHLKSYTATEPVVASPASEEKAPSPVAYWKFDDGTGTNANDATVNNLDGTLNNTPTWQTEDQCISGKCLYFNGTTNMNVSKSDDAKLDFVAADNFTIGAWVRRSGASSANNFIITKAQTGYTGYKLYQDASGDYCFDVSDGTNTDTACTSAVEFDDSQWHLVQGVKSGTTSITLYVDGKQRAQDASIAATGTLANTGTFYAGVDLDGTSNEWLGFLDEVKIYNYARSAAQIQADYNARANGEGASAVLGAQNQPAALSNGLVGYWKMDESSWTQNCTATSVTDSSGNANNGKSCDSTTGPAGGAVGKYGNAGSFDGSNDNIDVPYNSSLDATNEVTLAAWIKPTNFSNAYQGIIGRSNNKAYNFMFNNQTGNLRVETGPSGASAYIDSTTAVTAGVWTHVATVINKNDSTIKFYINGVLDNSQALTGTNTLSDVTDLYIGWEGLSGRYFTGSIDEARVYTRALSSNDISQLYNFAPGPVGYWKMDERSGTSAADSSGNGLTGTLTSGPTYSAGKYGSGVNFDGSDDYITVADNSSLEGFRAMTVCGWGKLNGYDATDGSVIAAKSVTAVGASVSDPYSLWNLAVDTTGKVLFAVSTGSVSSRVLLTSTNTVSLNAWHYICGTYDGTTVRAYIDGVVDPTTASTTLQVGTNAIDVRIGAYKGSGYPDVWNGTLDEVKVYSYARTQGQIIEDMNAGHPAPGSPVGTPLGFWKFDEGADNTCSGGSNDVCNSGSQGSTLDGAQSGMASPATSTSGWTQAGKFGKALLFDGTNDNVTTTMTSIGSSGITISAWIKPSDVTKDWVGFVDKQNAAAGQLDFWFGQHSTNGYLRFGIYLDGTNETALDTTSAVIANGSWYHVAATYDNHFQRIYINGVQVAASSDLNSTLTATHTSVVRIGRSTYTDPYFPGTIDEVKVYGQALTADQVKLDMNRGASQVLGALSDNSSYQTQAANQEYCIPGDSTSCASPVGRWDFEEGSGTSANDTSGNANTGTLTLGPTYTSGKVGKAISFDGSDDLVKVTDATSNQLTGDFTAEAWIYRTGAGSSGVVDTVISKWGATADVESYSFTISRDTSTGCSATNMLRLLVSNGTTAANIGCSTNTVSNNTWQHVAVTKSGTSFKYYINGALDSTITNASYGTLDPGDTTPLRIGGENGDSHNFKGKIDGARVFNYARSAAQVAWDYNRGGPVGWWKLDECQGTTANDSSGNSNTGTITIGASGTQTTAGTCAGSANEAWKDGVTGKRNYSLDFDGTDDYISVTRTAALEPSNITVSCWVKFAAFSANHQLCVTKQVTAGGANSYALGVLGTTNKPVWVVATAAGSESNVQGTALSTGTWYHLLGTYDGTTMNLYVNGVLANTSAPAITLGYSASYNIGIGAEQSANVWYMNGQIDDARVYNYALTATQVKSLYTGGALNFAPSTGAP